MLAPQRSSETPRLACKIASICLIPLDPHSPETLPKPFAGRKVITVVGARIHALRAKLSTGIAAGTIRLDTVPGPREFRTRSAAGQVVGTPYRFTRMEARYSPLFWLGQGYTVLLGPTMPIVGERDREPNDTYVKQLVSSARAAVEEVVRRGVADPDRIAIGGHSYGAFTAANLLVHSDLFCAGIAESGAYNRTLTPFGFQTEERTLWEAPQVYLAMSPFMHAQKLNEPILLIHGAADNNSGTFPIQSERFYHALKGHGATARLVKLPFESHSYRARESVLHVLWEKTRWLDEHVKNARPRKTPQTH